jgi:septum formation inhibitor-activating ATPase MinD
MLNEARRHYSYVLLDAPAGIEAGFQLAARYVDRILLVTGPDPASIRDASRASEVLELMGRKNVRLLVNRIQPKLFRSMHITVDDLMDEAGYGIQQLMKDLGGDHSGVDLGVQQGVTDDTTGLVLQGE